MQATKEQKKYIHVNVPNRDTKEEWVQWATKDVDKISCNDLTFEQANKVIKELGGKPFISPYRSWATFDKENSQHKHILSLCIQYGWCSTHEKYGEVANLDRLGEWLKNDSKCPVHKPLRQMEPKELSKIIIALEGMVKWKFK